MAQNKFSKIYARLAKIYDLSYGPILEESRKFGIHALNLSSKCKILEVGVGTGLALPDFPKDAHVVGVDISDEMLKEAQKKAKRLKFKHIELLNMSAEELKFPKESFDRVFCPSVVSVVGHPEKCISEMIRVCKHDGLICIVAHFTGENPFTKAVDKLFNPISSNFLGFRMNTPRSLIEDNPNIEILLRKDFFIGNFNTLYLLKKK